MYAHAMDRLTEGRKGEGGAAREAAHFIKTHRVSCDALARVQPEDCGSHSPGRASLGDAFGGVEGEDFVLSARLVHPRWPKPNV